MRIEWTEPALLESIRDFIKRNSEKYAARFVEKIIAAAESLEKLPKAGRRVPESEDENIRELLFQNYRIMYRAETKRILRLTIIHGARDLSRKEPKPWEVT